MGKLTSKWKSIHALFFMLMKTSLDSWFVHHNSQAMHDNNAFLNFNTNKHVKSSQFKNLNKNIFIFIYFWKSRSFVLDYHNWTFCVGFSPITEYILSINIAYLKTLFLSLKYPGFSTFFNYFKAHS